MMTTTEPFNRAARPDRYRSIREIQRVSLDVFECSMLNLVDVLKAPYANEIVEMKCHHCDTVLKCRRIVSPFVACDRCIAKAKADDLKKRLEEFWKKVCPARFRVTDLDHAQFPKEIYRQLRAEDPKKSFFLYGPTGTCKTRVAMLLLKHALLREQNVGVLWPEKLNGLKSQFDSTQFDKYAEYDLLLFDDTLVAACREPRLLEIVKQLIDVRMRHDRPFIMTSQINSAKDLREGKEHGASREADAERIDALIRRIREEAKVYVFGTPAAAPVQTEQPGENPF